MNSEFDFSKPFTMAELVEHYKLGSVNDPRVTRPLATELASKGYTLKVHRRRRCWAKWPEYQPFVMPEIP